MNSFSLIKISLKALRRNKLRTFLTMLGIIIGVASVITMLAIGQGSKKSIQDKVSGMGANLIIVMPGSQFRGGVQMGNANSKDLTLEDASAIEKQCPSVSMVSPEVRTSGQAIYANENTPTTIYGVNEKYLDIKKLSLKSGRVFTEKEIKASAKVCLIGKTVLENLFGKNYDPIGVTIRFNSIPIKIIGVLQSKGQNTFGQDEDDLLLAPYTTIQKRMLAVTHVQGIFASAVSETKSKLAETEIETLLRERHNLKPTAENDFEIRTQEELVSTFSSISNVLTILLGAIAGISLLVGGIGIMNIMYVSVTERTREIGLRMSVGGRGLDILMQFLSESILISVIGGLLGIGLGIGASRIVAVVMKWPVVVMPKAVILSFLVCSAIGIFFGWYPARKAANLDPIDALRYE
ncbi:MAG: ABC transporter permease [Bacteroidales bacterium]|jgi:putative ABC transport system permease protein|nr:ABC transporter permease [Bacteroidales bacterium]